MDPQGAKRGPRVTRLAIVLAGLVLSLFVPCTAAAARSEFFGIVQGQLDTQDLQGMAAAGIRTERFELGWKAVEPSQGTFRWAPSDQFIGALAAHGIRPVPFVWRSPPWVASNPAYPPLDTPQDRLAWRNFLKAAVARYGPGGSYWANGYRQQYGAAATPLPIQSWQVWNEPNLKKFFDPDGPDQRSVWKYARLLRISHNAIKSQDPQAQIVLAGMPGYPPRGGLRAWDFLDSLYRVPGITSYFDAAALHPYSSNLYGLRLQLQRFTAVMRKHGDQATPLWLTELGWGSAPPDRWGINQGIIGQQQLLRQAFKLILSNRSAWNVQRLFWFLWRDPAPGSAFAHRCSFCGSGGLLRYNGTRKPAFYTFQGFTAETTRPQAHVTAGPSQGGFTNDSTPNFRFASNEAGSTFECHVGPSSFETCSSPYTVSPLPDGRHTFFLKAIDAPGNESHIRARSFTVDTIAPGATISSGPPGGSTSSNRSPSFGFASNESGASFRCQIDSGGFAPCSSPYAASPLANGEHTFQVKATDEAGNTGSAAIRTWRIGLAITSGPASGSATKNPTPTFRFSSPDSGGFSCQLDSGGFAPCSSPFTTSTLSDGTHTFTVEQGTDTASRAFTVDTAAPAVTMSSGPADGSATNDSTPTFRFSSTEPRSTFECRYQGEVFSACSGASSDTASSPLSDGLNTFYVKAIDAAKNQSEALSRSFTVDTVKPKVTIKGPTNIQTKRKMRRARATFSLKSSEQVRLRCRIDSRPLEPCSSPYRTPRLRHGLHHLKVKAIDRAGNVGTNRKRFRIVR